MKLSELLECIQHTVIQEKDLIHKVEIRSLVYDSRKAEKGSLFVCIHGDREDGHLHIEEALDRGAVAVVTEKEMLLPEHVILILVKDTREALAYLSASWFHYPVKKLNVIGITGTKGKTTTAYMIYELIKAAGHKVGLIGTIETIIGEERISSKNTTPESFTIQEYFDKIVKIGCEYVVMEVSSQGIKQKRVEGVPMKVAVFTNFAEDHVGAGEHESLEEYRYYKSLLFKHCEIGIGNLDDREWSYMFRRTSCEKYGFTCESQGGNGSHILCAENVHLLMGEHGPETTFTVDGKEYHLSMPGIFNVYNALAAIQTVRCLNLEVPNMAEVLNGVEVKGRMQRIITGKRIACYVDYAHNAWSLQNVLATLRRYQPRRILLVFGCGGNRAKSRRTEMGAVAGKWADLTILTSDNPRFEDPGEIVSDIEKGMKKTQGSYLVILDRKEAIAYALEKAQAGDVVLIAGKGHENYQEIEGRRYYMNDCELVRALTAETGKGR